MRAQFARLINSRWLSSLYVGSYIALGLVGTAVLLSFFVQRDQQRLAFVPTADLPQTPTWAEHEVLVPLTDEQADQLRLEADAPLGATEVLDLSESIHALGVNRAPAGTVPQHTPPLNAPSSSEE